jgi:P pilus assembly chaperone PapD
MNRLKWALAGLLGLIMAGPIYASTLVEPGKFILTLKPGERVTNTISVKNVSDKATVVRAVVYDWTLNDQDQMLTSPLGTRKDSLNGLIKFNPRVFNLEAGASQLVRFTLSAPKEPGVGEFRGIVYFEEESQLPGGGVNAKLVTQVGSTIYMTMAPGQLKFKLTSAKIALSPTGELSGNVGVRNEGSAHARYEITYKVVNEKNVVVAQDQTPEKILLPGFEREVTFPVPGKFPPGKYNLFLEIKFFNTDQTLRHSIPFTL